MMTPLSTIINNSIKAENISKPELAISLGYRNISKCLRRLDSFMFTGTGDTVYIDNLQSVLKIPCSEFRDAISETIAQNEQKNFTKPLIQILSGYRITSFSNAVGILPKLRVSVPVKFIELPFEDEISAVSGLYQKQHGKLITELSGFYVPEGFIYERKAHQKFKFDVNGNLKNAEAPFARIKLWTK